MDITKVLVRKYEGDNGRNALKGFATVTLDDELVLTNIKIVKGSKGLFIAMPSTYWESDEKYHDIFFPITADLREELTDEIIQAYKDLKDEKKDKKDKKDKKGKNKKKKDEDEDWEDD